MDFQVTEEIDIFRELFWDMLIRMQEYLDRQQITNMKHPLYVLMDQLSCERAEMLGEKYKNTDDILKLQGKYEFIRSYMNTLEELEKKNNHNGTGVSYFAVNGQRKMKKW